MSTTTIKNEFIHGIRRGFPICMGYFPVSFTFGLMAVRGGIPVWLAIFTSLSNLTSAGQFAGTNLILAGSGYFEITLTTFIINIRYMLMSLSLSQKIRTEVPVWQRLLWGFGITDETFSVASMEPHSLGSAYMFGLILTPILGWTLGTAAGAIICSALPATLSSAMGIALYGMFIAIIVPPARENRVILYIIVIAVTIMCILTYVPFFAFISEGFRIIIATVLGAGIGAALFPQPTEEETIS
ncbi:MAG: AzlC family ABC transporter permease [Lachnospiraceae bacterium]|nr:AzlC family ABC transporter permease [Lachnospiraceae bacterium]